MKLLLDTSIFLWYISKNSNLDKKIVDAIRDPKSDVYLSSISVWESVIKYDLGKLSLPEKPGVYLPKQRENHKIFPLTLDEASIGRLHSLPSIHKDPFDRILICQCLEHNMFMVTKDEKICDYPVKVF